MPDRPARPLRTVALTVLALLMVVGLPVGWAQAEGTGPQPSVALPEQLDLAVEYEGQTLCDPTPKPGAEKLKALLLATYGPATIWIPRECGVGGQSEHKEGRAVDWMVGAAPSALRSAADAFVAWVSSADAAGNAAAWARRMGIMYIGWDDKIWRAYDPSRGWTELKGCFAASMQDPGHDTYCHRDHVHISLSWDGAAGLTSFWDGSATDIPACARRTSPVAATSLGSTAEPATVLNTATGKGIAAGTPCRLSADRWSGDARRVSVALPLAGAASTVQLRVERLEANAPSTLRLSSTTGSTATVRAGTAMPADVSLAVGADGVVTASVDAGAATVQLLSYGTGAAAPATAPPPPAPPAPAPVVKSRVSLSGPTYVRTASPLTLSGSVTNPPEGAVVRRLLRKGGQWVPVGKQIPIADGAWSVTFTARQPSLTRYRAALMTGDTVVSRSPRRDVRILPATTDLVARPIVTLDGPSYVDAGSTMTLTGQVPSAPAGAMVQRLLRVDGAWKPLGDPVAVADGRWSMPVSVPPPPRLLRYRAALVVNGAQVSVSPRADVRVVRPGS